MAEKFFAYYRSSDGVKRINAYEAVKLRDSCLANKQTVPCFWEGPNKEIHSQVMPRKESIDKRSAHFAYYNNTSRSGVGSDMTMTHRAQVEAISDSKQLHLFWFGKKILIYIKEGYPEYPIESYSTKYIIDAFLLLEKTDPSSYFYKWNGKLAIEVHVSHKTDLAKCSDLQNTGIQIFEVQPYEKTIRSNELTELEYKEYVSKIKKKYIMKNYLVGNFINKVLPSNNSINAERYQTLAEYEKELSQIQNKVEVEREKLKKVYLDTEEQQAKLRHLEEEIRRSEAIIFSSQKILVDNDQLKNENKNLRKIIDRLENDLSVERKKGFFERMFKLGQSGDKRKNR